MKRLTKPASSIAMTLMAASLLALGGCGSDSNDAAAPAATAPEPSPAPAPATAAVPVTVIDGPIARAIVCLDRNLNAAFDSDEPGAVTDATGQATLQVPTADVGKYPVVAMVGTDAVDADNGPVTVPFTLTAPADQTAVISPLTTLVQARVETTGSTTAQAAQFVQAQTGLTGSVLADYTAAGTADAANAAVAARLVVLVAQKQATTLAPAIGTTDISGTAITAADLQKSIVLASGDTLPAIGAALVDPAITGAADKAAALNAAATDIAANQSTLDLASAASTVGVARLQWQAGAAAPTPEPAPAAGATVPMISFTDAGNWFYRAFAATAADNTPDADGLRHFYDLHVKNTAGSVSTWGYQDPESRKGDLHWNGSAWVGCALGFRSSATVTDPLTGVYTSDYCDKANVTLTRRVTRDIAGASMTSVTQEIRKTSGNYSGFAYSAWGPANLGLLGNATFPPGSSLVYQTSADQSRAPGYDVNSIVQQYFAPIAAGKDAADTTAACASVGASTPVATIRANATTLLGLIAVNKGTPCQYNFSTSDANGTSGRPLSWWDQSTLGLGIVTNTGNRPAGSTGTYFTTGTWIRVGFNAADDGSAGTGQATFYGCNVRTSGSGTYNCTAIGTGSYTITTMADAKVLSLTPPPGQVAAQLTYNRLFVERQGTVYFGYQSKPVTTISARLNLTAANAVLTQLGITQLIAPQ